MIGGMQADQTPRSRSPSSGCKRFVDIIGERPGRADRGRPSPAAARSSGGFMFMLAEAASPAPPASDRRSWRGCGRKLAQVTGASLFLHPVQDLRIGGRQSNATYQYTLEADNLADLKTWAHQADRRAEDPAGADRRQQRPAGPRPAELCDHRPRQGRAAGLTRPIDRQHALRRLRPARRSRRSTRTSTSTMWSWRWSRSSTPRTRPRWPTSIVSTGAAPDRRRPPRRPRPSATASSATPTPPALDVADRPPAPTRRRRGRRAGADATPLTAANAAGAGGAGAVAAGAPGAGAGQRRGGRRPGAPPVARPRPASRSATARSRWCRCRAFASLGQTLDAPTSVNHQDT